MTLLSLVAWVCFAVAITLGALSWILHVRHVSGRSRSRSGGTGRSGQSSTSLLARAHQLLELATTAGMMPSDGPAGRFLAELDEEICRRGWRRDLFPTKKPLVISSGAILREATIASQGWAGDGEGERIPPLELQGDRKATLGAIASLCPEEMAGRLGLFMDRAGAEALTFSVILGREHALLARTGDLKPEEVPDLITALRSQLARFSDLWCWAARGKAEPRRVVLGFHSHAEAITHTVDCLRGRCLGLELQELELVVKPQSPILRFWEEVGEPTFVNLGLPERAFTAASAVTTGLRSALLHAPEPSGSQSTDATRTWLESILNIAADGLRGRAESGCLFRWDMDRWTDFLHGLAAALHTDSCGLELSTYPGAPAESPAGAETVGVVHWCIPKDEPSAALGEKGIWLRPPVASREEDVTHGLSGGVVLQPRPPRDLLEALQVEVAWCFVESVSDDLRVAAEAVWRAIERIRKEKGASPAPDPGVLRTCIAKEFWEPWYSLLVGAEAVSEHARKTRDLWLRAFSDELALHELRLVQPGASDTCIRDQRGVEEPAGRPGIVDADGICQSFGTRFVNQGQEW